MKKSKVAISSEERSLLYAMTKHCVAHGDQLGVMTDASEIELHPEQRKYWMSFICLHCGEIVKVVKALG